MNQAFEPKVRRLYEALRSGIGNEKESVRVELEQPEGTADSDVARALVQIVSACGVAALHLDDPVRPSTRPEALAAEQETGASDEEEGEPDQDEDKVESAQEPEPEPEAEEADGSADKSLLGQLDADHTRAIQIKQVDDAHTLLCVLRGGSLPQRRSALRRIETRIADRDFPGDQLREVRAALETVRDVELDYELAHVREQLGGAPGRAARAERDQWRRDVAELSEQIDQFWDAEIRVEPVMALAGEKRALLLLRTRELPDLVIRHICAVLEGDDGINDREARRDLLISLRYAGDPRLVPSLVRLLDSGSGEIVVEASRALRRIEDPRVRPALLSAFERSVVDAQRAALAGALGEHGERRAADYVKSLLSREDSETLRAALAALDTLGGAEDTEALLPFLEHRERDVATAAVRCLGRVGDGRALQKLSEMRADVHVSALRATIEDAQQAVLARLDLRGEEPPETEINVERKTIELSEKRPQTTAGRRFKAFRSYLFGRFWLAIGAFQRGIARLELSANLAPGSAKPLVALAMAHYRKGRTAQALAAFRRAVEADRMQIERDSEATETLAKTFLKRASEVEQDGRRDIARGLVGEALSLDLRRAKSGTRLALESRLDVLRRAR